MSGRRLRDDADDKMKGSEGDSGCLIAALVFSIFSFIGIIVVGGFVIANWKLTDNLANPSDDSFFPRKSDSCNDNNTCTNDLLTVTGGCGHELLPDDTICDDTCLRNSNGTCYKGRCLGDCLGHCSDDANCSDIVFNAFTAAMIDDEDLVLSSWCSYGGVCAWELADFDGNFDFEWDVLIGLEDQESIVNDFCANLLDTTDNTTRCLQSRFLYAVTGGDLDYASCLYWFSCSVSDYDRGYGGFLGRRKRSENGTHIVEEKPNHRQFMEAHKSQPKQHQQQEQQHIKSQSQKVGHQRTTPTRKAAPTASGGRHH